MRTVLGSRLLVSTGSVPPGAFIYGRRRRCGIATRLPGRGARFMQMRAVTVHFIIYSCIRSRFVTLPLAVRNSGLPDEHSRASWPIYAATPRSDPNTRMVTPDPLPLRTCCQPQCRRGATTGWLHALQSSYKRVKGRSLSYTVEKRISMHLRKR